MKYSEQEIKALVERVIAKVKDNGASEGDIPVGISNRHIHLSREHVEILFGKGYELQYSTDKRFKKGVKSVKVSKKRSTKKTIAVPGKGKTVYVRIRTVSGKLHSGWSGVKKITLK